jgi:outer membrane protein assembly factor BamB
MMRLFTTLAGVMLLAACSGSGPVLERADSQRTGYFSQRLFTSEPSVAWQFRTDSAIRGAALAVGRQVFVGTEDGKLLALDTRSGEQLWTFQAEGAIRGTPVAMEDGLFFADMSGHVYGLNLPDGELRWQDQAETGISAALQVTDLGLVSADGDGHISLWDPDDGYRFWTTPTGGSVHAAVAEGNGLVVLRQQPRQDSGPGTGDGRAPLGLRSRGCCPYGGAGSGRPVCLSRHPGRPCTHGLYLSVGVENWRSRPAPASVPARPSAVTASYVASRSGRVYALREDLGLRVWERQVGQELDQRRPRPDPQCPGGRRPWRHWSPHWLRTMGRCCGAGAGKVPSPVRPCLIVTNC